MRIRVAHDALVTVGATLVLLAALGTSATAQSPSGDPQPSADAVAASPSACPPAASVAPDASPAASFIPCPTWTGSVSWTKAKLPGADASDTYLGSIAVDGDGNVILLARDMFPMAQAHQAWSSTDGLKWKSVKLPWNDTPYNNVGAVTVGDVFLAVEEGNGLTGLSATGAKWKAGKQGIEGAHYLTAMTATPHGAAVGGNADSGKSQWVWTTVDGSTWARAEVPESDGSRITSLAATPSGLMAAIAYGPPAALWIAPDGATWQSVPLPFVDAGSASRPSVLASLTGTATGLLLVRNEYPTGGSPLSTVWSSTDGLTWTQVYATDASNGDTLVTASSSGPLGVVMVTESHLLRSADDGATWSETPLAPTFTGDPISVLGQTADARLIGGTTRFKQSGAGYKTHMGVWVGAPTP